MPSPSLYLSTGLEGHISAHPLMRWGGTFLMPCPPAMHNLLHSKSFRD